jgi:TRAP-type mannitol/chloroaromatic compound transport system permease small subunit
MAVLLKFSGFMDRISEILGKIAGYLVLACCLISAGNALIRYLFNYSSNGWLEIQWYLFAFIVLLGASHTLRLNEHVRVDLVYGAVSERTRLWIDTIGLIVFLIPASYAQGEVSSNAGGLIRWPVKFIIVSGFVLLALQGASELVKRVAALLGVLQVDTAYEKPLQ